MLDIVKNLADITFAIVGSIVAILTYRAAKETILQPVRTEVIKKQTDLLIDIMSLIDDESDFLNKVDYHGIIEVNILDSFLKCGTIFNDQEKIKEYIRSRSKMGMIIPGEGGKIDEFESIPAFEPEEKHEKIDYTKKYYCDAKNGNFKINIINITNAHTEYVTKLVKAEKNPFVPANIKILLSQLISSINTNISRHLRHSVENSINESFKRGGKIIPVTSGVFNEFNHNRLDHSGIINEIRLETRKYLKIDSMP